MIHRCRRLALLLGILLLAPFAAQALEVATGGSVKSLNQYFAETPGGIFPSGQFSANRVRGDLTAELNPALSFETSVEGLWLLTDPDGLPPLPGDNVNRRIDLERDWNRGGNAAGQLLVDRLLLRGESHGIDWGIGRQAIGFGRIVIFSPLDVIAPFPPDALDTEVRPGVDALRATRYFGLGGQLGGTLVFGQSAAKNSYLLTFSNNFSTIDLLAIGGELRERPMCGLGLAGSLGGLGLKAEGTYYRGRNLGKPGGDLYESFAVAAVEGWYRFAGDLVLLGQYLYNGPGADHPERYPEVAASAPLQEGLSFLLGRHYLLFGPSYELHPLVNLQGLMIWNLQDDSALLRPLLDISLADNLALQLFWNFALGESPRTSPPPFPPRPRSEFGSVGDSGGAFLKFFF